MNKFLSLLAALTLCISSTFAQTSVAPPYKGPLVPAKPESVGVSSERLERIDRNLNEWISEGRTFGCVALMVRNGKIVYHKAFGYDDSARQKPMRTDNIFRIASQTKAITSVAVMMLYEEGKFLLDDPVSRYLPEFAKPQVLEKFNPADTTYSTVPAKSEITIRQLLTHTSGIGYAQIGSNEANAIYAKSGLHSGLGTLPGRLLATDMKKLARLPLMHQPGERFTYGLNTDVLGYLVEVLSKQPLEQFFRKRIFEPLGMKDTYFYQPAENHARLVTLYEEKNRRLRAVPDVEVYRNDTFFVDYPRSRGTYFSGGAGLSSTALDYAIFLQMLLNGGTYNGKQLLARNTVRMMTMNQIGELNQGNGKFGLGFGITTEKGSSLLPTPEGVYEWGGAFATTYWVDPKEKLIGIIYRQLWGTTHGAAPNKFKVLVYGALKE